MTTSNPNAKLKCGPLIASAKVRREHVSPAILDGNSLTEYEIQALIELGLEIYAKSAPFTFSFQGLKRRLGIHQQKLTKALKRLIEKGLVKKTGRGYLITKTGGKMLSEYITSCPTPVTIDPVEWASSSISLHTSISGEEFIQNLSGKWFGEYRFVGTAQTAKRSIVEFTNDDNSFHVCCCLDSQGTLRMTVTPTDQQSLERTGEELDKVVRFIQRTFSITEKPTPSLCLVAAPIRKRQLSRFLKTSPIIRTSYS
ncbi:MAG: MarR family transcriptional regulator [Candidatus Ranarchaeia archaeon]